MMSCHLAVRLAAELTEISADWALFNMYYCGQNSFFFFCLKFPELGITCDMPAKHLTMSPFLCCFSTSLLLALLPFSCPVLLTCLLLGFIPKSRRDQHLLLSLCNGEGSRIRVLLLALLFTVVWCGQAILCSSFILCKMESTVPTVRC